ncbi:MAG: response regulator, partial [Deltaproteobacteria bacterium]
MSAARLLVVDDDAVTCRLLAEVLSRDGATVVWETDPRRALARAAEQPIDLAVLDVRMPELDGLELLRRLRERWPQVPVVIMTAFGSIDT